MERKTSIHSPAYLIWKRVGLSLPSNVDASQILSQTSIEKVPTPSLNVRPFLSTSRTTLIVPGRMAIELEVSEKACPILAAHFAGHRILEKSPNFEMTPLA